MRLPSLNRISTLSCLLPPERTTHQLMHLSCIENIHLSTTAAGANMPIRYLFALLSCIPILQAYALSQTRDIRSFVPQVPLQQHPGPRLHPALLNSTYNDHMQRSLEVLCGGNQSSCSEHGYPVCPLAPSPWYRLIPPANRISAAPGTSYVTSLPRLPSAAPLPHPAARMCSPPVQRIPSLARPMRAGDAALWDTIAKGGNAWNTNTKPSRLTNP